MKGEAQLQVTKVCGCCKQELPLESFSFAKKGKYLVQSYCKTCKIDQQRKNRNKNKLHQSHVFAYNYVMRKRKQSVEYKRNNPAKVKEHLITRKLRRKQCSWANQERIKSIYAIRDFLNELTFGIHYHVDHVLPLQGKNICGLHVENNLAVVPALQNLRKSNSYGCTKTN